MVVVVPGEVFRELEARVLVVRDDAVYDTGLLEDDEVAVDAALGQSATDLKDLGDRERPCGIAQDIDERGAIRGHPLLDSPQSSRDLVFECGLFECRLANVGRHRASVPSALVDPTERFADLVRAPEPDLALAALLIAAHDHPVDVAVQLAALDELAHDAPGTPEALARHLFVDLDFAGNELDYTDPRNSYLDEVLRRRLGIPITLSVLMLEVGRRRGLTLEGVGMPGHFLVRADDGAFYDPFHGGLRLDEDGCRLVFEATHGAVPFSVQYLAPVGSRAILARMLANLVQGSADGDPATAVWATRLRLRIPGLSMVERRAAAALLGRLGRFAEAATALDALAGELEGDAAQRATRDAAMFRARAN